MSRFRDLDQHTRRTPLANESHEVDLQLHPADAARTGALPEHGPSCRRFARLAHDAYGHPAHFRQNAGVRTTSSVKSSRRPRSIAKEHTQVWKSFSTA
jgi:hypothetical protein